MSAKKLLQEYIFASKYARFIPEKQRRETWGEAVGRVEKMMLDKYQGCGIDNEITQAYSFMRKKRILGSQRALQFGGKPALKKNARVFNCCFSYADRPRFFQEYLWLLLCGCGAGFSVQKHHVAKLPEFRHKRSDLIEDIRDELPILEHSFQNGEEWFTIPDTIEGWADALGFLLDAYLNNGEHNLKRPRFDYSEIRPKGSTLTSGVGKAPGPNGLRNSLEKIEELLRCRIDEGYDKLRPVDVYDICMHAADAVLSGGVRRSATIALFSPDDEEMATAKTGNWMVNNPQRARSNNSAVVVRNQTSREQFAALMQNVKQFGEPGFVWVDSPEAGFNPCVEIQFFAYNVVNEKLFQAWKKKHTYDAITCDPKKIGLESCWHFCNLSTINCSSLSGETEEEKIESLMQNAEAATVVGTLQAGFTIFGYLTEASQQLAEREALLGVSMTGMMDNYDIVMNPVVQRKVAKVVLKTNEKIAKAIGINVGARCTCLKPEGTGTLVLGSGAHGCHPNHYTRYLKAVQANKDEAVYQHFSKHNPEACEESKWSANKTDDIVYFPIEVPPGAKIKNQIPAIELLKLVKMTQQNWVKYGKREDRCLMPWLEHNVSNTITVQPDEWGEVESFIYKNRAHFAGISLVPDSADKDYPQAPNCAVYTSHQIVREYGDAAIWTSGLIELGLMAFGDLWDACSSLHNEDFNPIEEVNKDDPEDIILAGLKKKFWNKSKKFADKYFDGDIKRLAYCMKDVFNWKKWKDLNNSFTVVDYTELIEDMDNTDVQQELACSGGACTI